MTMLGIRYKGFPSPEKISGVPARVPRPRNGARVSRYGYIAYGKVFQKTFKYFNKALFDGLLDGWEERCCWVHFI